MKTVLTVLSILAMTSSAISYNFWIDSSCSHPKKRPAFRSAILGAQNMARRALTRLRDPDDSYMEEVFLIVFKVERNHSYPFNKVESKK